MPDPSLFGWRWDPLTRYRKSVLECPHKGGQATILAAKWETSTEGWTSWSVVDCSLLPAGLISCDMGCVDQLVESEEHSTA
jgi:hypothetical protein